MNSIDSTSEPQPTRDLFQTVYDELKKLAAYQLSVERVGHTLNPTALVHEVYLRLNSSTRGNKQPWNDRKQFFIMAAEAMRRILIDHARYHRRKKRGGGKPVNKLDIEQIAAVHQPDIIALNDALETLALERPDAAELVKLRYFTGLTMDEAAAILELSPSTADRRWTFAKTWLLDRLASQDEPEES
ncbi:MAG: ECF-type sigma factor [Gemmatales bacterium]